MKQIDVVFPIFAALWASGTLFNTAAKERNDKRDRILSGFLEGRRLSREHRTLMLRSDWLPLGVILICVSLSLSIASLCMPLLIPADQRGTAIWIVAASVSVYSFICSGAWLWNGVGEYKMMRTYIQSDKSSVDVEPARSRP